MTNEEKAKNVISKILYITIATVGDEGQPWNSPVYSAFDEDYNFYWVSDQDAQHSQNITANKRVFLSIYDSSAPPSSGQGVYIMAQAQEVVIDEEREKAYNLLNSRAEGYPWSFEELNGKNRLRLYKAVPEKFWINGDGDVDGNYIDVRIEVNLLNKSL